MCDRAHPCDRATTGEPMHVPGELADALARLLVLYLIATTIR
jgi:hypothetical protein